MKAIDALGFEALYARTIDPWHYRTSPFEAAKRNVLLHACGDRTVGRGLEIGCSIGETSFHLSRKCLNLLALDASPTAIAEAQQRGRHRANGRAIIFRKAVVPNEWPPGRFDLIVLSEVAYYLRNDKLLTLLRCVASSMAPGGRLVALHHTIAFDDASQLPLRAHQVIERCFVDWLVMRRQRFRRYAVFAAVKPRACIRRSAGQRGLRITT